MVMDGGWIRPNLTNCPTFGRSWSISLFPPPLFFPLPFSLISSSVTLFYNHRYDASGYS
jgi:hypothetical protein